MTYFWEKVGTIYHWSFQCSQVPIHIRGNPEWISSPDRPNDKVPCNECREMDLKKQFKKQ